MKRQDTLGGVPAQLWRMVLLARHRLLMLDYDGTLAPFVVARDQARPDLRSLELLNRIAASAHTTVAIVSGRPLSEVEKLIGTLPAIFVGEHGWEHRAPNGEIIRRPLEHSAAATLHEAERAAREAGLGELLERKRSSVVLHTRALPAAQAHEVQERCAELWGQLARGTDVALDRIDGAVELRARGRNKGTVVLSLLSQASPGTLGVFVGDDVTDEDAFEVVRDWGFGLKVGNPGLPSIAQGRLPACDAVPDFLEEWLRLTDHAGEVDTQDSE